MIKLIESIIDLIQQSDQFDQLIWKLCPNSIQIMIDFVDLNSGFDREILS